MKPALGNLPFHLCSDLFVTFALTCLGRGLKERKSAGLKRHNEGVSDCAVPSTEQPLLSMQLVSEMSTLSHSQGVRLP